MVFLFESDPATSLERENRDKLIEEHGQAMNPGFLGDLNEAYHSIMEKYSGQFSQLDIVNTGNAQGTSPQLTAFEVVEKIITQMEKGVSSSQ